jgi:hypothetical protein
MMMSESNLAFLILLIWVRIIIIDGNENLLFRLAELLLLILSKQLKHQTQTCCFVRLLTAHAKPLEEVLHLEVLSKWARRVWLLALKYLMLLRLLERWLHLWMTWSTLRVIDLNFHRCHFLFFQITYLLLLSSQLRLSTFSLNNRYRFFFLILLSFLLIRALILSRVLNFDLRSHLAFFCVFLDAF